MSAEATGEAVEIPLIVPDWHHQALCREDLYKPLFRGESGRQKTAQAIAICKRCPVRRPCLADSFINEEPWGVWGGVGERDRLDLLRAPTRRRAQMIEDLLA